MVLTYVSFDEIQGEGVFWATQAEKRHKTGNLKMQCLHVNISDRYTYVTNDFYSALFVPGHVGNRGTKVLIYSCNIPQFTMRRTQAKKPHINCRKGLRY